MRFGFSEDFLRQVAAKSSGPLRSGIYVPSELEVKELEPLILEEILIEWFHESPTELIPSEAQISQVHAILQSRSDRYDAAIQNMICDCRRLLGLQKMNRLLEQQREKLVDRIDKLNQQLKSEPLPGIPDYVVDAQQKQVLETIAVYEAEIRELDEQLK